MNKEDKERLVKLLGQNKLTKAGGFALHIYIRDLEDCNKEKDKEIERLNNIIDIKTNRIQQLMKRLSKRQEKVDRLNKIIDDKKERQDIAIRLLEKMFGTDDYEINYIIGVLNGQRQIHFEELEDKK